MPVVGRIGAPTLLVYMERRDVSCQCGAWGGGTSLAQHHAKWCWKRVWYTFPCVGRFGARPHLSTGLRCTGQSEPRHHPRPAPKAAFEAVSASWSHRVVYASSLSQELLKKETRLLQTIDKLQIKANAENKKDKIKNELAAVSPPQILLVCVSL